MKTSMLKTKELRVFYKKLANERIHSLQTKRNYTLIASIVAVISTIFLRSHVSSTVNFGLIIGFLPFVSVVLTIKIFLIQQSCTFSKKDLERVIKEVEGDFEVRKAKRKDININALESSISIQSKLLEDLNIEKKDLEFKEAKGFLSDTEKNRLIILEDDVLLEEKKLKEKESKLQFVGEVIRSEEIEDREYTATMTAVKQFIKDHFDVHPIDYAIQKKKVSCLT